ncbi:MAG: DUF624 domain-containing protein [Hungatella hathewayi]|uniref:DUF624 domain-containing protein n=1 Tax=Hungatella hathewayi TaxID=154046 RepID=UPI0039955CD7
MERVTDICVLSFFWFLFSIPAVTVGAATTALFQYTLRLTADEEGYVWKTFRKGLRRISSRPPFSGSVQSWQARFWCLICGAVSFWLRWGRFVSSRFSC